MNQGEWILIAIGICCFAFGHWASKKLGKCSFSLLRPLLEKLCPVFKMEPWLFESIAVEDLPPKQRRHFETHTPGFLARGFTHLGDFVLRRDPQPSCSRYFLSPDGTTIGGITCYLGTHTIESMSVLLNGLYIETANVACGRLPPKEHGLQFIVVKTQNAIDLIEEHADSVAKMAAEAGTAPARLESTDLQAVSNYGRQLSLRSLHQQGMLEELPAFLKRQPRDAEEANESLVVR